MFGGGVAQTLNPRFRRLGRWHIDDLEDILCPQVQALHPIRKHLPQHFHIEERDGLIDHGKDGRVGLNLIDDSYHSFLLGGHPDVVLKPRKLDLGNLFVALGNWNRLEGVLDADGDADVFAWELLPEDHVKLLL